uniref:Protein-glutamine gamma-glutamyltransferase 2 n=1 Tax=Oncorhynchus tshawytscha TaxID=74940 RepID=A0A8C8CYM6_ONCTS
ITEENALDIERCDLESRINNTTHHTDQNGIDRLIVRRGLPFTITLHLRSGSQFEAGVSTFRLIVEIGPLPKEQSGTKSTFSLTDSALKTAWSVSTNSPPGNVVSLSVSSPPDVPIGLYSLTLDQGQKVKLGEFVLLFNPWCAKDAVYMEEERDRQEYVLSQAGLIYKGTTKRIKASPWTFGQFEPGMLDICLKLLDENPKYSSDADADCSGRRNPVYVTRVISAMINSNDDKGVLVGNWSGDYDDGVRPSHWTDSVAILHQWADNCCQRVRYGQCWVFAAVACTVSRALGIPCRVVTNFGSAHDTNSNLLIEFLYDEDGNDISDDSVWNFHVWVDNWMARPDLDAGYDGWQASDPTPQEKSEGVFCCGPVPLKAIKEGELNLKYDAPFVFAEVNADVVEYVKLTNGRMVKMGGSSIDVGHFISTKAVGSDERHDITHLYKHPEGSLQEREVFERAKHHHELQQKGEEPGLKVKIKVSPDMDIGADFDVFAVVTNNTEADKTCRVMFYARIVSYDGKPGANCGFIEDLTMEVPTGKEKRLPLRLEYVDYGDTITSDRLIQLVLIVIESSPREFHKAKRTIVLENPDIAIKLLGEPRVNQKLSAQISLQNPLPEPLQNCFFSVIGASLTDGKLLIQNVGTVGPKQEAKYTVEFTPTSTGSRTLTVDFDSDKLSNIKGYLNIEIKE